MITQLKNQLKTIAISGGICLIIGIIIGFTLKSNPTIQQGAQAIKYLSNAKLSLPEFNRPSLKPTGQLIFLKGDKEIEYRSLCEKNDYRVPLNYPSDILFTRREPVSQDGNQLQFRYYDPKLGSEVINTYQIERSPWRWQLLLDGYSPVYTFDPIIGPRFEFGHRKLMFNMSAYLHPSEKTIYTLGGVSLKLAGN